MSTVQLVQLILQLPVGFAGDVRQLLLGSQKPSRISMASMTCRRPGKFRVVEEDGPGRCEWAEPSAIRQGGSLWSRWEDQNRPH